MGNLDNNASFVATSNNNICDELGCQGGNHEASMNVKKKRKKTSVLRVKQAYKQYRSRFTDAVFRLFRLSGNNPYQLKSSDCYSDEAAQYVNDNLAKIKPKRGIIIHRIQLRGEEETGLLSSDDDDVDSESESTISNDDKEHDVAMETNRKFYDDRCHVRQTYGSNGDLDETERRVSQNSLKCSRSLSCSPRLGYSWRRSPLLDTLSMSHRTASSCDSLRSHRPSIVRFCEKTIIYIYPSESYHSNCNYYNDTHLYNGTTSCHCDNFQNINEQEEFGNDESCYKI